MLAIEHSLCCIGFEEFRWKRVQVFSEKNYIIFDNTELKWCQQKYQSGTINPYWQGSGVRLRRLLEIRSTSTYSTDLYAVVHHRYKSRFRPESGFFHVQNLK